jgi:hypothetical protein
VVDAYVGWCEEMLASIGSAGPTEDARMLVAVMDGLLLDQMVAPDASFEAARLADRLHRFIAGLLAGAA